MRGLAILSGSVILATPEHPFYANGSYTPAQELRAGDSILTADGKYALVESINTFDSIATVYNLEVANDENYYVGEGQLLVHNSCGWLTIKNSVAEELFNRFHLQISNAGLSTVQRKALYDAIAGLSNRSAFLADFANDAGKLAIFGRNPRLIDSWKVLKEAGVTGLSNKIDDIKFVDDYLKKNPEKAGTIADDIKNKGWQKWKDDLVLPSNNLPSLFRQLTSRPSYLPERIIFNNPRVGTTITGKWDEVVAGEQRGLKKIFEELSQNGFTDRNLYDVPVDENLVNLFKTDKNKFIEYLDQIYKPRFVEEKGAFNLLDIDNYRDITQALKVQKLGAKEIDLYIWEVYNKPWLEKALQRGDDIIIWSNPKNISKKIYPDTGETGITFFEMEVEFMKANASKYGYNWEEGIISGILKKR